MLKPAQLAARRLSIGGSDAGAVLGVDPYTSPLKLYQLKLGEIEPDPPNPQTKRGTYLEPIARKLYRELTQRVVRTLAQRTHADWPWMTCHVDGLIVDPRGPGVLEIKAPNLFAFAKVKREGLSLGYIAQMQHNLAVTGFGWGSFALFNADLWELIHFDVKYDVGFAALLIEKERAFWFDHVQKRVPPEPVKNPAIDKALAALEDLRRLAGPGDVLVRHDAAWSDAARQYLEANDLHATADQLLDSAKDRLKALMGSKGAVEGAGVRVYWRDVQGVKTLDKGALQRAHPEVDFSLYQRQGDPFEKFTAFPVKVGVGD